MTRSRVSAFLVAYLLVVWTAVVFRIDRFPLTWAPMYSVYKGARGGDTLKMKVEDQNQARRGFLVTRRDGSQGYVGYRELNISKWTIRRLYFRRVFGKNPPKAAHANHNLSDFNRWAHGLEPGEKRYAVDWDWRLFWTVNKTLGHEPDDPEFIVRLQAQREYVYYDRSTMEQVGRKVKKADLHWQEAWRSRWDAGRL